jgi:hypothetical protein
MKAKLFAAAVLVSVPLAAQWLNYKTPGIPRTPDGKPNLSAPAPRSADGKPDLSGIWRAPMGTVYGQNIAAELKPGDVQPWAEQVYQQRVLNLGADSPRAHCLPDPPPFYHAASISRIVQASNLIMIVTEGISNSSVTRTIYTDGRGLPEDPNPSFLGYSVGHWEGDTMVVTSAGFNDRTWLDGSGHPHTEALRTTERFHRRDFGHMDFEMTIDDPKAFTKPFTLHMNKTLAPDTDLLESICEENERIVTHLRGGTGFRLTPEVLSKYAGNYEFAPGRPVVVTSDGDLLFLQRSANGPKEPFAAQSETVFLSRNNGEQLRAGDRLEFVKDSSGAVTQFVLHLTRAGDQKAVRKGR